MELEEKQVHRDRRRLDRVVAHWNHKEWWYTGCHDPASGVYLSWHIVRVNFTDQCVVTLFDPALGGPRAWSRLIYTDPAIPPGELSLRWSGRAGAMAYTGRGEEGWRFDFEAPGWRIDLTIRPTLPPFTKFDNPFARRYALLHFAHSRASGRVEVEGQTHDFADALTYQDHCFGHVPRRTAWHWLAVQSEAAAVVSLVNYGPYAQCYSQAWLTPRVRGNPRPDAWIRLDQSVSFESRDYAFETPWRVTSPEVDLEVTPLLHADTHTRIPVVWPFLVDLRHVEAFVRVEGRLRVDGRWVDPGPMHGVMEAHGGVW